MATLTPVEPQIGESKRAQYFRSALTLAVKKGATGWSQESLLACLGTWGDENPQTAADLRVQIGQYIQQQSLAKAEATMERHKGYEGIDAISAVVADAKEALVKAQVEGGETVHLRDAWRSDLSPRAAVHAVTVPLIEAERVRLESEIEEVERLCEESLRRFREHRDAAEAAELEAENSLDRFTEALEAFNVLDMQEIEDWTMSQVMQRSHDK